MPLPGVHLHLPTPQAPDQRWLPLPAGWHQLAQPAGPRSPPGLLCLGDCEPTGVSPAPLLMTAGHPPGPPAPACAVRSARCPPTLTLQVSPPADPVGRPCRTCSPCLPSEVPDHGHCPARSTTRPSSCPPQRPLEHRDTKSTLPPRLSPWWLLHPRQGQTRTLGSRGIQQAGGPCPRGQEGLAEQSDRTLLLGGHGPTRASRVGGAVGPLFPTCHLTSPQVSLASPAATRASSLSTAACGISTGPEALVSASASSRGSRQHLRARRPLRPRLGNTGRAALAVTPASPLWAV